MKLPWTSSMEIERATEEATIFFFFEIRGTAVFIIAGPVLATGDICSAASN